MTKGMIRTQGQLIAREINGYVIATMDQYPLEDSPEMWLVVLHEMRARLAESEAELASIIACRQEGEVEP